MAHVLELTDVWNEIESFLIGRYGGCCSLAKLSIADKGFSCYGWVLEYKEIMWPFAIVWDGKATFREPTIFVPRGVHNYKSSRLKLIMVKADVIWYEDMKISNEMEVISVFDFFVPGIFIHDAVHSSFKAEWAGQGLDCKCF